MIIMSRICFITCMSWVRILVWSCRGGRGGGTLDRVVTLKKHQSRNTLTGYFFFYIHWHGEKKLGYQSDKRPSNQHKYMSGIIFLSSVQQWSKKSVSYKVNACDHQFSSNRLARQNGVPWQISSKYLKITNENDESASPLCFTFFSCLTQLGFFSYPTHGNRIGELQAQLRIRRRWLIFNFGLLFVSGGGNKTLKKEERKKNNNTWADRFPVTTPGAGVTAVRFSYRTATDVLFFLYTQGWTLTSWFVGGPGFVRSATTRSWRLWVFVPWLHTVSCARELPITFQHEVNVVLSSQGLSLRATASVVHCFLVDLTGSWHSFCSG